MLFNIKNHKNDLLFIPLGGSSEIGMNVNLYHYQGKFIMVDCGSGFADDYLPGVDMVVADISFILKHKKDLLALILTHAHEDHLGAVQYLWQQLGCPIYTTNFTANFLKIRLSGYNFSKELKIHEVKEGAKINLAPFKIEMVPLTHSAPEMQALMIRTEAGNVLHTGDWKFDHDPIIGKASDQDLLRSYGDEGVLALVCDSTNIFNKGVSGSEGDLRPSLVKIISECPKMVVVTTFASNLARLDTLIHAAQEAGRKVVLSGKSLHRMMRAAQESGYLQDIHALVDETEIGRYKREELLVIATGCQGEQLAATAKMAFHTHRYIKLTPKDTIIFSSKIIPGNEKKIFRLFNIFVKSGIEVITERDHFVHVSGHPAIEELRKMYELVRPQICIPVHGEPTHIHEHVKFAKTCGIKNVLEVENGKVSLLSPKNARMIGTVHSGYLAVDGSYLIPTDSEIFKTRRELSQSGVVFVAVMFDKNGSVVGNPVLAAPGLLDDDIDQNILKTLSDDLLNALKKQNNSTKAKMSQEQLKFMIRNNIRRAIKQETSKKPVIIVNMQKIT